MPRLRNFDTKPPPPYCYEFRSDNRLESVANAHTAADLHVRPVSQTALVSRAVGVANVVRDTACPVSRNGNDSAGAPAKPTSASQNQATGFVCNSKVLNLIEDSMRRTSVTFSSTAKKKVTIP